jgi:hypothetical protein
VTDAQKLPALGPEYEAMFQPAQRRCAGCGLPITLVNGWWQDGNGGMGCGDGDGWKVPQHRPAEPTVPKDSAGPADLQASASPSGTGGPAAALDRMVGRLVAAADEARALAQRARAIAEEQEGRRRELWDWVLGARREWEVTQYDTQAGYAMGLLAAFALMIGRPVEEDEVSAGLDAKFGTDRAQGGEPRA